MKKKFLHIVNWDQYQARGDKDMPWCKLWGSLFTKPWFQKMNADDKYFVFVLFDISRKTGNKISKDYLEIEYLRGNYGVLSPFYDVFKSCKALCSNDFLSDYMDDIEDKIREDKIREDKIREETNTSTGTFNNPSQEPLPSPAAEVGAKTKFGESGAVLLTEAEHSKLVAKFGVAVAEAKICKLENYILSKGVKYKSHYHTILSWEGNDQKKGGSFAVANQDRQDKRQFIDGLKLGNNQGASAA